MTTDNSTESHAQGARSEPLFAITTEVAPAPTFMVDDRIYTMKTTDYLSDEDEAALRLLIKKEKLLQEQFDRERSDAIATRLAARMRDLRTEMLTIVTDMPYEVAAALKPGQQARILAHMTKISEEQRKAEGLDGAQ
jgi:hypothetical protein